MTDTTIGLHLVLSAEMIGDATPESFATGISDLLAAVPVASAEFVPPQIEHDTLTEDLWWRPFLRTLVPGIQRYGTAALLRIPATSSAWFDTYRAAGMDGVVVTDARYAKIARDAAGQSDIVGSLTGPIAGPAASARHDAMVAAESGADVVIFRIDSAEDDASAGAGSGKDETGNGDWRTVQWWTEMMEAPCIAIIPPTPEAAQSAKAAAADFVGLDHRLWAEPNIRERLTALNRILNPGR
ncbi:hypothetical protein [Fodinicurvata sp. EGI_FJ10296]|uniref:hypothetical protein n=1 Tax=Fodinicurvata sp. EGI_FJ10296 TaxID=3231908 RepID=UPI003452749E